MKKEKGFTLIEILLVISLMAILTSIVIFAINPPKQLADSRDAQRESDVFSIVSAIYQYAADNEGSFPSSITTVETEICATDALNCTSVIDLSVLTDGEAYLVSAPVDPLCASTCTSNGTGYFVNLTANGRLLINASSSENKIIIITQ
ncbi:MAG: prepilin-type N-terminal cleavage/methylation domain-containing protein [Acidimicrobiales bacterium]|jgi:prepilin-type N-terminal cleavage/methylation domain-containing protein